MKKLVLFVLSSLYLLNISSMSHCNCGCEYDHKLESYKIEISYNAVKRESFKRLFLYDSYLNLDKPIKIEDKELKYKSEKVSTFGLLKYSSQLKGVKFDKELFEELIKNGANKDLIIEGKSLLISAMYHNNLEAVKILLDDNADPDLLFPLIYFTQDSKRINFKILELLLSHGADPNLIDKNTSYRHCSPLFCLIERARFATKKDVWHEESTIYEGKTYITRTGPPASEEGLYDRIIKTIKLLLEYGANPNLLVIKKQEDESGCNFITPYGYAKENNLDEIVSIFDEYINADQLETLI